MSTIVISNASPKTDCDCAKSESPGLKQAFGFEECKRIVFVTACIRGSIRVFRSGQHYHAEVSGEATINGSRIAGFRERIRIAKACKSLSLGRYGKLHICFDNVRGRQADIILIADVMGYRFEVYRKTIGFATLAELEALAELADVQIPAFSSFDDSGAVAFDLGTPITGVHFEDLNVDASGGPLVRVEAD